MTSKLSLYNGALQMLGERRLAALTEDRGSRRDLDAGYDDVVLRCLEAGYWKFAMRTVQIDAATDLAPTFGYTKIFVKPADMLRLYMISASERFDPPLDDYQDEQGYWYCDTDPIYVRYVSSAADLGLNLATWSPCFCTFVEGALALRICKVTTNSATDVEVLKKDVHRLKTDARAKEAMKDPSRRPPMGTWANSRSGGWTGASRWNRTFR